MHSAHTMIKHLIQKPFMGLFSISVRQAGNTFSLWLAFWGGSLLSAQAYSAAVVEDEILVTGTRSEKLISDASVPTVIIKKADLDVLGVTNLAQALQQVPGLYLTNTRKNGQSINLNGYSSKHVLVLLDGNPLVGQGEDLDLSLIPVDGVERIEVVKGSMSAYYGSGAMGGVVNIITRKEQSTGLSGAVSVGGSYASTADYGSSERVSGNLRYESFGIEYSVQEQKPVDYDQNTDVESLGYETQKKVKATAQTQVSGWFLSVSPSYEYREREKRVRPYDGVYGLETSFYNNEQEIKTAEIYARDLKQNWVVSANHQQANEESGKSTATKREANRELSSAGLTHHIAPLMDGKLYPSIGMQWQQEQFSQETDKGKKEVKGGKQSNQRWEAFARVEWIEEAYEAGYSIRGIADERFNEKIIQQLQGQQDVFSSDDQTWTLRASVGQGYRAPTLKETHYIFDHSTMGYIVEGNKDLKPETSLMSQVGFLWQWQRSLQWELNFSYDQIKNLIEYKKVSTPEDFSTYQYDNIDEAKLWATDTRMIISPWDSASLMLGYTYIDARDGKENRLMQRPRHMVQLGVDIKATKNLIFKVQGMTRIDELYEAGIQVPIEHKKTAWLWDVASQYHWNQDLILNLGINNITDQRSDAEEVGFDPMGDARPAVGRTWQSSIQLKF